MSLSHTVSPLQSIKDSILSSPPSKKNQTPQSIAPVTSGRSYESSGNRRGPVRGATPAPNQAVQCREGTLNLFEHTHRPHDQVLLEAELTTENYKEKFHQLLCREEEEHEKILQER